MTIALVVNLLLLAAATADLGPGDRFPEISLPDQHGASHLVSANTRLILFAADKPASDLLNGFLQNQAADLLARNQAEYIADISSMPGLITRLVALPRMRERPYRILLVEQADQVAFIPRRPGSVTVLRLDDLRVLDTHFAENQAALVSLLGTVPGD